LELSRQPAVEIVGHGRNNEDEEARQDQGRGLGRRSVLTRQCAARAGQQEEDQGAEDDAGDGEDVWEGFHPSITS
jgi:hypothetical protein